MIDDLNTNDFLNLLYRAIPYGMLELTLLKANGYPKTVYLELPATLSDEQLAWLHKQNEYGQNVYFGVTVRNGKAIRGRGKVEDALFTRVLWVDMDDSSESALCRLKDAKPSLIVHSGGGYHGYWLLNYVLVLGSAAIPSDVRGQFIAGDNDLLKRTLKGMAIHLSADVKVAEFARIMRLPYFKNMKEGRNAALCHVVHDPLFTYDFDDLANQYAYLVKETMKVERTVIVAPLDELPLFIKRYLETGASEGDRNITFNKMCWAYNGMGKIRMDAENELAPRARADGLTEHEIQATLDSAFDHDAPALLTRGTRRIATRDKKSNGRNKRNML